MSTPVILSFGAYLAVLLVIGAVAWTRTGDLADYILGGRRLGSWVTALSAGASDMSGWLLLGLPGYAYLSGFEAGWLALGLLAGTYLNWRLVAAPLRRQTESLDNSLTLPEYFANRFDGPVRALRLVAALFILVFFTFYASSGLVAGGRLFETVFEISYVWAVSAGALAIILYTLVGGFFAVSWTDFFQGSLMFLALVAVAVVGVVMLLPQGGALAVIGAANPELLDPFTDADGATLGAITLLSLLGWGLGYFGQPHILARFMAIRDAGQLPKARRIAMTWVTASLAGALAAGLLGIGLVDPPLTGATAETVFMRLIDALFHPVVAGVLLAAILAAIMSTADSQLLVASSALTEDLYKGFWKPDAAPGELLWLGRGAVLGIAVLAWSLALDPESRVLDPESRVLDLVAYAWAGFGAAFGPAILLSLYWQRMTGRGALAGIVTGGVTVIVWAQLEGGLFELYELVPGFALSWAAIVLFSRYPAR